MSVLAQVIDNVATPRIDWWGVMPVLLLAVPAMVMLHVTSLLGRPFKGFYALVSATAAVATIAWSIGLWLRVTDADRGPFSTVGGAYGVDGFSVFVTIIICCSVVLASLLMDDYLRREDLDGAEGYALLLLSASGGVIMASANDLIVLFLGLEILSLAVYVMAAMHTRRVQSQEAGMKYFVLGGFSSAFFLYGIALIYGATGSTSLLDIADFLAEFALVDNTLLLGGMALLLVGFAFKIAAVPFHSWTPDVYQGSPSPVVAYMASGVKVAGFAGLLRVFSLTFATQSGDWQDVMAVLAAITLVVGSIAAVVQTDVKRMMAYSSIAHAGYILVGVQAASARGTSSALFYLAAYTFLIAGTFGVITLVGRRGDHEHGIERYRGLGRRSPALALVLALFLFAQAGVPPSSGFFAKFGVIRASIEVDNYWLAIVAMVSSVVGAFVYLRIGVTMFAAPAESRAADHSAADHSAADDTQADTAWADRVTVPWPAGVAIALAAAVTVVVGVLPGIVESPSSDAVPALVQPTETAALRAG